MTYHQITKKLKKMEKKFPQYNFIALSKNDILTTEKGTSVMYNNITMLPKIYKYLKDLPDSNIKNDLLKMIGE